MNSDYPPLPRPGALKAQIESSKLLHDTDVFPTSLTTVNDLISTGHPESSTKVISPNGDVVIQYADYDPVSSESTVVYQWQVTSELLVCNSPYFRALLDPSKFSEGRLFMEQQQAWNERLALKVPEVSSSEIPDRTAQHALPTVKIPGGQFARMCGVDAIELFLKVLCVDSLPSDTRAAFENDLKFQSPSLVARLIEVADAFNSPRIVQDVLRSVGYAFGKSKISLFKFSTTLLKLSEDRIRQIFFVAAFLKEYNISQVMAHTLLVAGSRSWVNGPEAPAREDMRWRYFSNGIEEELYYRRQCVLNTITDLQAYFLRIYGALEDHEDSKPTIGTAPSLGTAFSTSIQNRHFQCRGGFGNASQCDVFHLGQITRFFSLRARTIFLGSTLIDPDFSLDVNEDDQDSRSSSREPPGPPSDITTIIASLKQLPDYQIDSNHIGCGVRRRLLPALDCIEKFVLDGRGLLGIDPRLWDRALTPTSISWASKTSRRDHTVDIRFARITAVHYPSPGNPEPRASTQGEDAQLLFTAKKRNWEA